MVQQDDGGRAAGVLAQPARTIRSHLGGGLSEDRCWCHYAAALTAARGSGRISKCYAEPLLPLKAFWDVGGTGAKADNTVIWIAQFVGREIRMLDYYEAQGQPLATHVQWLRKNKYEDALMVLPHDGAAHDKVHAVSYESELQRAGFETQVVPNQGCPAYRGGAPALPSHLVQSSDDAAWH